MKFLIVMRGHCNRFENIQYIYDNYFIKIKNPLLKNGHTLDCMFNTYNGYDEYFEKFKELYNPIKIFRMDTCKYQYLNFYYGMINIQPFVKDYDKIVFLRFDICYKINIMKWNIFNDKGIFFPFTEIEPISIDNNNNYNGDCIIIIDNKYFDQVYQCVHESIQYHEFNNKISKNIPLHFGMSGTLHNFKNVLLSKYNTFPIYFLLNEYYNSRTCYVPWMKHELLNPLYIMMGRDYFGDMNDFILLERL